MKLSPCFPFNPCGSGHCSITNILTGAYACTCPGGFIASLDSSGQQTCALGERRLVRDSEGIIARLVTAGYHIVAGCQCAITRTFTVKFTCTCPGGLRLAGVHAGCVALRPNEGVIECLGVWWRVSAPSPKEVVGLHTGWVSQVLLTEQSRGLSGH